MRAAELVASIGFCVIDFRAVVATIYVPYPVDRWRVWS